MGALCVPAPLREWLGPVLCFCLLSWVSLRSPEPLPGWCCTPCPTWHCTPGALTLHCSPLCLLGWHRSPHPPVRWHCTLYPCLAVVYAGSPAQSALCSTAPCPHQHCTAPYSPVPTALHPQELVLHPQELLLHLYNICPCTPAAVREVPEPCPIPHPACSHRDPEATPALGHPKAPPG